MNNNKYKHLMEDRDFQSKLPLNTAIVGNGPSELGKGRGNVIDNHDYVLRLNNFSRDTKFKCDYGEKTDLWATQFYNDINPPPLDYIKHVYCIYRFDQPKYYPRTYTWKYPNHISGFESITSFIPENVFSELWKLIVYPSSGLTVLWWYWRTYGFLRKDSIFGFSFFDDRYSANYWNPNSQNLYKHVHSGFKEKSLVEYMHTHCGITTDVSTIAETLNLKPQFIEVACEWPKTAQI